MEERVRPINTVLIREMAEKLDSMVKESEPEAPYASTVEKNPEHGDGK